MKYCVVGKSLPHTLSPEIHRAFGNTDYGVTELEDVGALGRFVQSKKCDGYNVTIPYKRDIIPMLDVISDEAAEIGAVNTVVYRDGKLTGYNTDIGGMAYALKKADITLKDKDVMILGSGGTCMTASCLLRREGAKSVTVVSRTGGVNYENCYDFQNTQVIINTTPLGMMPHAYQKPVELCRFKRLEGVFDCIYNPLETLLIKEARELNIKCANGLAMLVEQARLAHALFFGDGAEAQSSNRVLEDILMSRKNIVLTGMSGAGKSAIGRRVARLLDRPFVDTDSEIERAAGMSIPQIFSEYGEAYFRRLECEAVERACLKQGAVISTGGGAILDEKNVFFMRCNGDVFLIERNTDELEISGRPLTKDRLGARTLYESRKPKYFASAHFVIKNDATVEAAAKAIADIFKNGENGR